MDEIKFLESGDALAYCPIHHLPIKGLRINNGWAFVCGECHLELAKQLHGEAYYVEELKTRILELEGLLSQDTSEFKSAAFQKIKGLEAKLKTATEALKTYGNRASWGGGACTNVLVAGMKGNVDGWMIAKEALKALEGDRP